MWDGHGGEKCSQFCSDHISSVLDTHLKRCGPVPDLGKVLSKVIHDLNDSFAARHDRDGGGARSSGTTATVALIRDGYELVVGQVGDSRALLCRGGRPRPLTRDHCASDEGERERIESAGGAVAFDTIGRCLVNGRLAMM